MNYPPVYWMKKAFLLAEEAYKGKEIPVGAIIVHENTIIGKGFNQVEKLRDATAHAEMLAITAAANYLGNWRLEKASLYVTKEPCVMCAGAILNSRIEKLYFAAYDKNDGAAGSKFDVLRESRKWFVEVIPGIMQTEGEEVLKKFFNEIRSKNDK